MNNAMTLGWPNFNPGDFFPSSSTVGCTARWMPSPLMPLLWLTRSTASSRRLIWRPIFGLEWIRVSREVEVVHVEAVTATRLALTGRCQWEARLPLNQIFDLAIESLELPVIGLPP